jgi:hypothetical protein
MKKNVLQLLALLGTQCLLAQTTHYELKTIAEGNFGTPNGDVFSVTVTPTSTTQSTGQYQAANGTTGFDVLQDFQIAGNKAVFLSKSSGYRIVVANYPSKTHVATFSNQGAPQTIGKASNTKVYVAVGSTNGIRQIDLINNTISAVSDPGSQISGTANYMVGAKGFMYVAIGSKIVKIDTLTAAVTGTINPGLGSILGLEYDAVNEHVWVLGKTGSGTPVSTVVKMEVANNDLLNTPIVLTGVTNAGYLRYANNKLYFLSGKNVHAYNILVPNLPTTAVYTSSLSGSWDFAYGKAFYVEAGTGNMAFGSANAFTGPSLYEIVNGTTMSVVASGSVTGCIGVNELILRTYTVSSSPVPVVANLPVANGQCSVALTAPTANGQSGVVTGTTSAATTYTAQGTYTLSWTYSDAGGTSSQTQTVVVLDNTAPVPNVANLPTITVSTCSVTLTRPTATDNCSGTITATTTAPLTYTVQGTYTINWVYLDAKGNTASQSQTVVVNCNSVGLEEVSALQASVYPNPANDVLTVSIPGSNSEYAITVTDQLGKIVLQTITTGETALDVKALSSGLYYMNITHKASGKNTVQKIVVSH